MNYKVEKVQLVSSGVRQLLKSDEVMQKLKENANLIGDTETNFVGFDRCHVIVKDNNNAYRENNS